MPLITSADSESNVDLSVVILNWNACDYLIDALDSILENQWRHAIEVVVVDNNSVLDDSIAVMQARYAKIPLIAIARNVGFSAGNNQGWRASRGRHILFLNPDTIVHEGALDALVDYLDDHPAAGACGPKMQYADGRLQPSCRAFPSVGAGLFRNTWLGRLFPRNPWTSSYLMEGFNHDREAEVDWLSGSALCVRRPVLEQVGGWDEEFFMYCEDVDLCYRIKQAGFARAYVPAAVITHRIGASSDWAQGAMIRQHHGSMLRYFRKHHAHGTGLLILPFAAAGIGLRALGAVFKLYRYYLRHGMNPPGRKQRTDSVSASNTIPRVQNK